MRFKKITAALSAAVMSASMLTALPMAQTSAEVDVNYAEALQKSLFFYEVQQAGTLPEWNSVSWRANSMLKEDGTPADVVDGGWFDAGDHLKFTLTNAYSAWVLGWGLYSYKDAVKKAGLYESYLRNLKWGLDYVSQCDLGDKVIGTIGESGFDHVWWGSCEVYMRKFTLKSGDKERPYDEIDATTVVADMASALAVGSLILKDEEPDTAAKYLEQAKSLFERADKTRSNKNQGIAKEFYNAAQTGTDDDWFDELMVAANFLYMATGDKSYLDKCESDYIPMFALENQSTDRKFTWGLCWDDVSQAAALLYAQNTGKQEWIDHVTHHLEYWTTGYGGKQVNYTPDGHAWLMNWGSMRHMANTVMLAKMATDTILKDDKAAVEKYDKWAKEQFDYAFGDNDLGMSYVIGMGDKNAVNVHHRTSSGVHDDHWNELGKDLPAEDDGWQYEYAHVLYGALEGGPAQDGSFKDENAAYEHTEVAIDYNAGFTSALCAFIAEYGGEPLADFPPKETPKWAEWKIGAGLNNKGNHHTEVKVWAMNHTAWPTRVAENVSFNYYFDVSEVLAAGNSVDDIVCEIKSQQYQTPGEAGYATISGPYKYEGDATGNTYYAKIQYEDGRAIMPTGQSEHRAEVQFRVSIPDSVAKDGCWDPTNDYSYEGIEDAPNELKYESAFNQHITMYVNDILVWGTEPDGTTAVPSADLGVIGGSQPTPPTTTAPPATGAVTTGGGTGIIYGDANVDGIVDIADATLVLQVIGNGDKYKFRDGGERNADVCEPKGITPLDALAIMEYDAKAIGSLPKK